MSEVLKDCPCCGGEARFYGDDHGYHWISCQQCGIGTNTYTQDADDCHTRLAELWNRRTSDRPSEEKWTKK